MNIKIIFIRSFVTVLFILMVFLFSCEADTLVNFYLSKFTAVLFIIIFLFIKIVFERFEGYE